MPPKRSKTNGHQSSYRRPPNLSKASFLALRITGIAATPRRRASDFPDSESPARTSASARVRSSPRSPSESPSQAAAEESDSLGRADSVTARVGATAILWGRSPRSDGWLNGGSDASQSERIAVKSKAGRSRLDQLFHRFPASPLADAKHPGQRLERPDEALAGAPGEALDHSKRDQRRLAQARLRKGTSGCPSPP